MGIEMGKSVAATLMQAYFEAQLRVDCVHTSHYSPEAGISLLRGTIQLLRSPAAARIPPELKELGMSPEELAGELERLLTLVPRPAGSLLYQASGFNTACIILVPDFAQVNAELLEYFAVNPAAISELNWRQFERLLEAIFKNHGYRTEIGPGSGDGGIDLRLLSKDSIGEVVTLVQAKRYASTRPVSLEAVSALYGVVEAENANRGLFVTTSRYLASAHRFAKRTRSRLILATVDDVARWCRLGKRESGDPPNPYEAPARQGVDAP